MEANNVKSQKLAIYLLKDDIETYKDALKKGVNFDTYSFNSKIQVQGKIVIGKTKSKEPEWKELLQEGTNSVIPDLNNQSNRAVVFFLIDDRLFAIPFGYGKHLLNDEVIDRDFGLITALNIINADKLIGVDKANIGDLSVLTRTQASKKGTPDTFNIDVIRDLLKSITGEPYTILPEKFGSVVTGNEGLYISPKTSLARIPAILSSLKIEFGKDTYKDRFGWIDNIKPEKDPTIIDVLRADLLTHLKAEDSEFIHLAPPFIMEWEEFDGFSFTPKGEIIREFDIRDFYRYKHDSLSDLDWEKLKGFKLHIKSKDSEEPFNIGLWRFINYETQYNTSKYIFTLSNWYRVDKDYYEEVYNYCKQIPESKTTYTDCGLLDHEGDYNTKLSSSNSNLLLLDKKLIKSDLTRSGIEACDLFAKDKKELIHVKFRKSSATLSHLFAQGRVSANSLKRDKTYRKNLRSMIKSLGGNPGLVPLESKDLKAHQYTITFAIIERKIRTFVDSLPFFSLVNLRITAEELTIMGFKVNVKKINIK